MLHSYPNPSLTDICYSSINNTPSNAIQPFPKPQILDSSRLYKFAYDNFKFDKMSESSQIGERTLGEKEKLLVRSNFSFSRRVFKRLVLHTRKNQGLFGKGLTNSSLSIQT